MEEKILHKIEVKTYEQIVNKKYRNYKWILYASILGLSLMFLSLTFMYYVSNQKLPNAAKLDVNPLFYFNTFMLLASSIAVIIAQHHYREDNYAQYKISLLLVFSCAVLFLIGQTLAWYNMFVSGHTFEYNSASYLYIISGAHALHLVGGLIFLAYFILRSWKTLKDYATSVVYFTDPVAKAQLHLFGIFWHFLGVLWLYLLFFFLAVR